MEARKFQRAVEAELPESAEIPHTVFAFEPGWLACTVFGVLWAMAGKKPGSLPRVSTTSIAGLMCCDPRTVRDAIQKLVTFGLVDRLAHDGTCLALYVNDPTSIAVARKLVADPQRLLIDDDESSTVGAEIPAQESPRPHVMEHGKDISKPCSMRPEIPAQNSPPIDPAFVELQRTIERRRVETERPIRETVRPIGETMPTLPAEVNVFVLTQELERLVDDRSAPRALFFDVASAIAAGEISRDYVQGIISECRGPNVRSRGGLFRSGINKAIPGGLRRRFAK